jgi:vanillate/3-O-methylgallate O-demethylase
VYDSEAMKAYRQWASGDTERAYGKWGTSEEPLEATFSFEGSFDGDDISEYYMSPVELGYGKLIDFDHDFVGKEALQEEMANPDRTLVSLLWDQEDVERVNNSLFGEGDNYKQLSNLPRVGFARQMYDKVLKDGELVGISHGRSFQWDVRGMVSLCRIDVEHSDPGTEVTLVWGEPGGTSPNPKIEDHTQTEISATVKPAPYTTDKRGS